jgi:hypothetical protein
MEVLFSYQIRSGFPSGWQKIACNPLAPAVRVAFNALSYLIGPIGAHLVLGSAAIGLWYLGHSAWNVKERDKFSMTRALVEIALAAGIIGSLIVIGGGSTALSFGVASGIALVGVFV